MPITPGWEAAENGLPVNLNAINHASQITQHLGTHNFKLVYEGNQTVVPSGGTQFSFFSTGNVTDWSQPFVQPVGVTTVGRVALPLRSIGNGADLLVRLCTDNGSGFPDESNVLSATSVPASWLNNLQASDGLASAGPLAIPDFNYMYGTGSINVVPWAAPAVNESGVADFATIVTSGNYTVFLGGHTTSGAANNVCVSEYLGSGNFSLPIPQPSLPVGTWYGCAAATTNAIIYAGGSTNAVGNSTNVWVASWDPNTGVIGSWSAQTPLPVGLTNSCMTSYNNTVYVFGGIDNTTTLRNNVYYATLSNGQFSSWNVSHALPQAIYKSACAVVGNRLWVLGGSTNPSPDTATSAVYYADIASDGSLSSWQTIAPNLPVGVYQYAPGWGIARTDSAIAMVCGFTAPATNTNAIQILTSSSTGYSHRWQATHWRESGVEAVCAFDTGSDGQWDLINPIVTSSIYSHTTLTPVPMVSIPLCATGLTPGSKYHVVLSQHQKSDTSEYIQFGVLDDTPLPNPLLVDNRHTNTWHVSSLGATWAVPMCVFDLTATGNLLHTWEDPQSTGSSYTSNLARRSTTRVTSDVTGLLLGVTDAVTVPNDPLNSNPTFTTGTSPWTATGCALTQSNAQTHGGYLFSGLMTPDGVTAAPSIESDRVPIVNSPTALGNVTYYMVNGWLYSPTGLTQVSLSVNWFDHNMNYLATTFTGTSLSAATWTNVVSYNLAPSTAAYAAINPTITGTPGVGNTLYLSNVTLTSSIELTSTQASVASISYGGTAWPPTGVTTLT